MDSITSVRELQQAAMEKSTFSDKSQDIGILQGPMC